MVKLDTNCQMYICQNIDFTKAIYPTCIGTYMLVKI